MAPPPPKLGQRDLFNDSFFSFLKRKDKSQPQPAPPPGGTQLPDSQEITHLPNRYNAHSNPRTDESLGEKKVLLQEGHRILDSTKELLERNQHFFRKETLKRLRKEAAKLTKGAPAKSKLPKKSIGDVSSFQEGAKVLYQEVDNIIREMDHNQDEYRVQQGQGRRSGSESPPPLPRKPPSPKVTFPADLKPDTHNTLARHQSVRRGVELSDPPPPPTMTREETMKHRYRDQEAEVRQRSSQRPYDRNDRKDDGQYRDRDDRYRSRRAPDRQRDEYHRDRDKERTYRQDYYSSRSGRHDDRDRDRYRYRDRENRGALPRDDRDRGDERHRDREREDRVRHRDRDRDRDRDREDRVRHRDKDRRDRDRHNDREREKEGVKGEETTSADRTPQRVVHPDIPLSATPSGSGGIPVNPTIVPYPVDEEGRRRDRDRERERHYRDRERGGEHRDRDRDRKERDRDKGREPDPADRDRDRDRDRYYGRDRHKSRRYDDDDEYRGSGKSRRGKERDGEQEEPEPDRDRDRGKGRQRQATDSPPSPTDPSGSKFQEVFSPPEHAGGLLPPHPGAAAWNG